MSRESFIEWLSKRIEASLPSIRATISSVNAVTALVAPDGSVRGNGASTQRLDRRQLDELWKLLDRERFDEIPDRVGAMRGPDSALHFSIEVRRGDRRKTVHILGLDLELLPPEERDAAERALRIWKALPIART